MTDHHAALALLALAAFSLGHCDASAQDSDAVTVARVCWSESGPDATECTAIAHVLVERAALRGVSVRAMARAYSPRATGVASYGSRSWIAELHPDRRVSVPGRSDEWVRVRFAALVAVAWRALRGIDATPCAGALHWSARWCRGCRDRMRRAGLAPMGCGLSNVFFGEVMP